MLEEAESVTEVLRRHAEEIGGHDAVVFVEDAGAGRHDALSYARLDHEARRIAATLQGRFARGDRVLLAYPSGTEFARAFFGCLYAGMVAVPAPLPGGGNHYQQRITHIAGDADVSAVLTCEAELPTVSVWLKAQEWDHITPLATDATELADAGDWRMPPAGPGTPALLQYTSGTTAEPKGVVITHGNLLHNAGALLGATGTRAGARFGGWSPLYHDMGIGLLVPPLLSGGTSVLIAPMVFLRRPHRWLELIGTYRLELSAAPNFAYGACVRQTTDEQLAGLDLSSWRWALNGSEPIDWHTVDAFRARFESAGYRAESTCPVYGLAEATVYVSGISGDRPVRRQVDPTLLEKNEFVPLQEPGEGHELVGCGRVRDHAVRIAEPDSGEVLPEGRVGEIWLRGASIGSGYWRMPAETRRAFGAVTACGDGGYLRTGDLGVLFGGELHVMGRLEEALDVGGRRFYPHHLEREVEALLPGEVAVGAAVRVSAPRESVVMIQEVRGRFGPERLAQASAVIRACLERRIGSALGGVVLVRRGAVRRTTSGKVRRTVMRDLFLAGEIEPLHSDVDPVLMCGAVTARPTERRTA